MTDPSSLHDPEEPAQDELPWEGHEHAEEGLEEPYGEEFEEEEEEPGRPARDNKHLARLLGTVALIAAVGGGGWYAFSSGMIDVSGVLSLLPFGASKDAAQPASQPQATPLPIKHARAVLHQPEPAPQAAQAHAPVKLLLKRSPRVDAVTPSPNAAASAASFAPVQLAPGTPSVQHNREFDHWRIQGLTFMYEQKPIEAMAAFKKALSLKPGDRSVLAALNSLQKALDASAEQIEGQVINPKPKVSLPPSKKPAPKALLKLPMLRLELPAVLAPPASQVTPPKPIPGKTS